MTKNDLISGMVVEQRNGNRKLVVDNMLIGEDDWGTLDDYFDGLTAIDGASTVYYGEFDIVKVYEIEGGVDSLSKLTSENNFIKLQDVDCIWTRGKTEEANVNSNELAIESIKDVANGMIVETREGVRYLVLDDLLIGENGWNELSDYEDDLRMNGEWVKGFDIVKVYNPDKRLGGQRLSRNNFGNLDEEFLVWVRTDEKAKVEHILEMLISSIDSLSEEELKEVIELGEKIVMN